MYKKIDNKDIEFLKSIIPTDRILVGDEISDDFYHDELSGTEHAPDVLIYVTSTEETAAVMK